MGLAFVLTRTSFRDRCQSAEDYPMRFLGCLLLAVSLSISNVPAQNAKQYDVDIKKSRVYIRVDPDGRGHAHGMVGNLKSGTIALGDKGKLVFDQTSFMADEP